MIFDTDILIWVQRGNGKASSLIDKSISRMISVQTYMELLQCANSKKQQDITRDYLHQFGFKIVPFTENIGHRAAIYVEEYSMQNGLRAGDAIIAASAVENRVMLATANQKHYKIIPNLELHIFKL
ncbi:MAG: twitching motility protein PilT [Gammaproteobacteria bacterium RIFCSPHIGHO2_12_FULL_37_34]|nr:MAG: twitching motility protein PilT [Gammaproteobacteria bacterium RIFCSPHIGHO2_12_FULL_37_34]